MARKRDSSGCVTRRADTWRARADRNDEGARTMGRAPKKGKAASQGKKSYSVLEANDASEGQEDSDLPKDEAGRRKIKRQYETLLGIRIEKLKGRILNRERINKTIEGVYFICIECKKVCHNMDD